MAKLKKCTDKDISTLLDTNSDLDAEDSDEHYSPEEIINNSDSTDSEQIFQHNKSLLLKTNILRKEHASLKLKLRRSTEQSSYRIDTDSEHETPRRSTRSTRQRLKNLQDENIMPRKGARTIKVPKRYSDYDCTPSKPITSILRREQMNYNENKLFLASLDTNTRTRNKDQVIVISDDNSDNSNDIHLEPVSSSQSTKSNAMLKNNKRNHVSPVEDINNATIPKVIKTKSSKHIPVDKKDNKSDCKHNLTPHNKSKVAICENENEDNVNEVAVICKITKDLSIKSKQTSKRINDATETAAIPNGLSTPKSCKPPKHSALTPSIKMRAGALSKPLTPLQKARSKLHVSAVPKSLPCREEEFNNIYTFLESKLMDNSGGCIYISGVPGTGKTATVNEVIKCLKRSVTKGKLEHFDFVEINGMKLSEPRQAYVQILKQLSGNVLTWEQAYNALERKFKSNIKRPMTLLLVDELDLLCTSRQDVVYSLLDWPAKLSAQLVVITIANTMDLPERVLMGRVTSRLGLTRVTFQPYNHKQLQEIVLTRLKDSDIFKSEAVQLIARKVSAVSGDARRALDICRRAAEITEIRNSTTVSMKDVNEALSEMIASPKVQAIKHCSRMEQVFLQAVCTEVTRIGVEEVCFVNVYKQFESLCSFDGIQTPNITETLAICARLGASRLLICEHSRNDIHQRILLNVSTDDVHYALQQLDHN